MAAKPAKPHLIEPWLEVTEGSAPVLLIAPHGGRAAFAPGAMLHPKVNDLHTAEIARELAARLGATAFINSGMDRNRIDCNRIAQLSAHAPWLLEMIADRLEQMVARNGRALALVIHGWNVIEPRVDIGLGLKSHADGLRPYGQACVSASDEFINGPLADLVERLRREGVIPTFGLRYPAGGKENLLQAFTERHRESPIEPLARLGRMAAAGALDAAQLELSVGVRWPGRIRERSIEIIADTLSRRPGSSRPTSVPITVMRTRAKPAAKPPAKARIAPAPPVRVGVEFFDPAARLGVMASFDLGHGAIGARIMLLIDGRRVALFTSEGKPELDLQRIAHGPLALRTDGDRIVLEFKGPTLVTPDGIGYLSVEHALAQGDLEEAVDIAMSMRLDAASDDLQGLLAGFQQGTSANAAPVGFGSVTGMIRFDGRSQEIDAIGRIGVSFTNIGAARFRSRRMLWAHFPDDSKLSAVEARTLAHPDGSEEPTARLFAGTQASECLVDTLDLEISSPSTPPGSFSALLTPHGGRPSLLRGEPESFLPLSRPGPDLTRIHTSLGFATFRLGDHAGAGMYEYSHCAEPTAASDDSSNEDD